MDSVEIDWTRNVADIEEYYNYCSSVASMLRFIAKERYGFLFEENCWNRALSEICKNVGACTGIIDFLYPKFRFFEKPIRSSLVGEGRDDVEEIEAYIGECDRKRVACAETIIIDNRFPSCRMKGVTAVHKFSFGGILKANIYLFTKDSVGVRWRNYTAYLINHCFVAIEGLIRYELRHLLGKDRVEGDLNRDVDLNYFFAAQKIAIFMFVDIRNFTPLTGFYERLAERK